MNNLNNLHQNIQITSTLAKSSDTTSFYDIFIQINQVHLQAGLYRKPTHCGSVLDSYSYHADLCNYSVTVGKFKRVKNLSTSNEIQELGFNNI